MFGQIDTEIIVEFISQSGAIIVALISILGSGIAIVLTNKKGEKNLNKSIEEAKKEAILLLNANQVPLSEHPSIPSIEELKREARNLYIPDVNQNRVKMASYYLEVKYDSWGKAAQEFAEIVDKCVDKCDTSILGCNLIYTHAMDMYNKGMEYEINCLNNLYGADKESMEIFNDRLKLWHEDRKDRFKKKIYNVCMTHDTYRTCNQKGSRILEALVDALDDTLKDVKITILRINGQLDNHSWRGESLETQKEKNDGIEQ